MNLIQKKPNWIKVKFPIGKNYKNLQKLVSLHKLNTICQSGSCPNIGECWEQGVATFMILGNVCTRSCRFCGVKTGRPENIDWKEPEKVAKSIKILKIKHAVITSVNRDDLKDMGASIWIETIKLTRKFNPGITIETLIPDFKGEQKIIDQIIDLNPEVISHNVETISRLTKKIRIQAKYDRSLKVLQYIKEKNKNIRTKTGIMLGLGEKKEEILETMKDIKNSQVDILTIGQYLQPSLKHFPVHFFVLPEEFKEFKKIGLKIGFKYVESGPLVRSSYHAEKHVK
ncbi:lipoyl synthase [Blattabacterium punctulatus]|uniref:Lipoyl synthase n=2 Tax=Blattabacterium punctulatus TaxID=164514 RepID=A0ABN5M2G3_9FLAO|nr:lipoyl synthase [Blattabacterium punctulatus]AWU39971.1 lipoyl synthase [Blattabacterium punctulatus]AWU40514.1 lipoyl synthase [Blattabacterium punctulatus]AWU42764.1 lipoyl synthase [Blattabacterium punctulatus]AWU43310.1 lipoyl synthase [Blattabacterium punctulatus]